MQGFYDWYGPLTNDPGDKAGVNAVLKDRRESLDPALATALANEAAAQAGSQGEAAGLDHDPFVNAQDTCGKQQRFEVGNANEGPTGTTVEVYAICDGTREATPRVVVSLALRDGKWVIIDFGTDNDSHQLTTELRSLAAERAKNAQIAAAAAPAQAAPETAPNAQEPGASSATEQAATATTQAPARRARDVQQPDQNPAQRDQMEAPQAQVSGQRGWPGRRQDQQRNGVDVAARQMLADGRACFRRQDYTCAITNATNALRIEPGFRPAMQLLARAQAAQSQAMNGIDIH